jgi:release factor glutamine methyltransferase
MSMTPGEPTPDLAAAVREATMTLAAAGIASAPVDAVLLAAHLLDVDTSEVRRRIAVGGSGAPGGYAELVARRATRVPLQHLTGQAPFRTLTMQVGPGVFVPRPETELIVDHVLRELARGGRAHPVVVDLCTGSGAIALSVKAEAPYARVVAVELSPSAVQWATLNRDQLGLDVEIITADARTAVSELVGHVDVVVCNPPYIPDGATPVDPEVRDYDPQEALYGGGARGLDLPVAIAIHAAALLRDGGALVMEHADVQGATLPPELAATGLFTLVVDHPDLVGRPRHVVARR